MFSLSRNKFPFILTLWLIIIGGSIYVLWRPTSIRFLNFIEVVGLSIPLEQIRSYSSLIYPFVPEWIIYSLPNGLWAFSYSFLIIFIWYNHHSGLRYLWFATVPFVALGYEMLQQMEVIAGTFCFVDISFCFMGMFFGAMLAIFLKRRPQLNEQY